MDHSMSRAGGTWQSQILRDFRYALGRGRMVGEVAVDVSQETVVLTSDPEVTVVQTDALDRPVSESRLFPLLKAIEGEL